MSIELKFIALGAALTRFYDESGQAVRLLTELKQGYEALLEQLEASQRQVEALENMDEIRDEYRRLAMVAIHTTISVEEEAAIDYGRGDELLKKLEELDG